MADAAKKEECPFCDPGVTPAAGFVMGWTLSKVPDRLLKIRSLVCPEHFTEIAQTLAEFRVALAAREEAAKEEAPNAS